MISEVKLELVKAAVEESIDELHLQDSEIRYLVDKVFGRLQIRMDRFVASGPTKTITIPVHTSLWQHIKCVVFPTWLVDKCQ